MKNLQRIGTKYSGGQMAERSRIWHYILKYKLPKFEAFDPGLNMAFTNAYRPRWFLKPARSCYPGSLSARFAV